jgi:MFS family permease
MATAASEDASEIAAEPEGGPYAWLVLGVLILAYTVSFIDRQALTLMVDPIRASLNISDTQLSVLHGFAFAIFYTIMGIPIGRLVDRRKRTLIIAGGIAIWSIMTAMCGLARNFFQMFLARIGVGVGEAALSPGAYSLLGDYFPPRRLPLALSIYTSAAYAGSGLAIMIGGALIGLMPALDLPVVGAVEPWQGVFIAIGLPGLLVALAVLMLREPPRTKLRAGGEATLADLGRQIGANRGAYLLTIGGYSLASLVWNGALAWFPTFFMRTFGWSATDVGVRYGLTLIVFGMAGIISGGILGMRMRQAGKTDANVTVGVFSMVLAMPAGLFAMLIGSEGLALAGIAVFLFATCMPWGCAAAAVQEITPNQMRGQLAAIYLFAINIVGLGFGPTVVATLTDGYFQSDAAIGQSIALAIAITAPLAILVLLIARRPYREAVARVDF